LRKGVVWQLNALVRGWRIMKRRAALSGDQNYFRAASLVDPTSVHVRLDGGY